jgi:hypothetical protein
MQKIIVKATSYGKELTGVGLLPAIDDSGNPFNHLLIINKSDNPKFGDTVTYHPILEHLGDKIISIIVE